MFKKVEAWVLYLVTFLMLMGSILFAVFFGFLVRQELVGSTKLGWFSEAALKIAEIPVNFKRLTTDEFVKLDLYPEIDYFAGDGISDYYLLLSRYNGDIKEGVIELIDLESYEIKHSWNPNIDLFNSKIKDKSSEWSNLERDKNDNRFVANTPEIDKDLNLYFHGGNPGTPFYKIDSCSNLVWMNQDDGYHHSIEFGGDGKYLITPGYKYPYEVSADLVGDEWGNFSDDSINFISSDTGKTIYSKSVTKILLDSDLLKEQFSVKDFGNPYIDPIHLNDIVEINSDFLEYKKGDLFLSVRSNSTIYVYRPVSNEIIKVIKGPFISQHDIDIDTEKSIMIIFNNNIQETMEGEFFPSNSNLVFYDLKNNEFINPKIQDKIDEFELRVNRVGAYEFTDNGELLIAESNNARIIALDPDGNIITQYANKDSKGILRPIGWGLRIIKKSMLNDVKLNSNINCEYK